MSANKVIFHIDEMAKWKLLLTNLNNLVAAVDARQFNIEVLANAEAVKYYQRNAEAQDSDTMQKLKAQGVKFVACNNALKAHNIQPADLFDFVEIVPAGIVELIDKQGEGYAYIRP